MVSRVVTKRLIVVLGGVQKAVAMLRVPFDLVDQAKRPETRARRITATAPGAHEGGP
jgi:hypothetical protein